MGLTCLKMVHCGLFVCMVSTFTESASNSNTASQDTCREIGGVLTEKFQRYAAPTLADNLRTCSNGVTCCNTVSEYFFEKRVQDEFTDFALYTVKHRLDSFNSCRNGYFSKHVNWEVFAELIERIETQEESQPISYEHFFEMALREVMEFKPSCMRKKEVRALKKEAMPEIVTLVNNIYAYKKGIEALNITLLATAAVRPSQQCADKLSRAGIPLEMSYRPSGCPLCLDSTANAKVCKALCENVVRGCYASILQYKDLYLSLVREMDHLYYALNYHLETQEGGLNRFYDFIGRFLKKEPFLSQCRTVSPSSKHRRKRRRRQGEGVPPDLSHYKNFFSKQLDMESAIVDPASLPCAVVNNNSPCWTGDGIGNYQHLAYSYTKEEQDINPEGADKVLSEYQESAVIMLEAAYQLALKAGRNETLFPVMKADVEGATQPPTTPTTALSSTGTQFTSQLPRPDTATTRRNGVKTIAPDDNFNNNVESWPTRYNFDTNARQAEEGNEAGVKSSANHISKGLCYSIILLVLVIITR